MIDDALRHYAYPVSHPLQAPGQIDLLHMHEELFIESAGLIPRRSPDGHCSTRCPEDVARVVVLARIDFDVEENPTSRKRISEPVDKPARRTRILEPAAVIVLKQLRLYGGDFRILECTNERLQPTGRHLNVSIRH